METLLKPLEELNSVTAVRESIQKGRLPIAISGCIDSQKCHLIAGLTAGRNKGWQLIITSNEIKARELLEDYQLYDKTALYYPARDVIFYSADVHGNALSVERLKVIQALLDRKKGTVVTTMAAGMELVQSLSVYRKARKKLQEAGQLELDSLVRELAEMGYERREQVEAPGEFSVRGGILDVFSLTEEAPFRIELWGDEIDTIQTFDVESQRSIERLKEAEIFPASEVILTAGQLKEGLERMDKEKEKVLARWKRVKKFESYNRLAEVIREAEANIEHTRGRIGIESYLPYFDKEIGSFFDYFDPAGTLFFIDEASRCQEAAGAVEAEFRESMAGRLEQGYILPGQMEMLYSVDTVQGLLMNRKTICLGALDILPKGISVKESFHIETQSIGSYNKHFELLVEDMKRWKKNGYRVILLSASRTRAQRLSQDLNEYEIPAFYRESLEGPLESGQIMVGQGRVRKGFAYNFLRFVVVTEGDIFGARNTSRRRKQKKYSGKTIQSFHELNIGDYVVHENHGIGIYQGIEKIKVDHVTKDYVKIQYGDGGNLYVPASGLDVLQKYASQEARAPKLNKLNSVEWKKTKSRVRGAVREIAGELVKLYAIRQEKQGFAFSQDTVWQREFEELFPYEETQDQLDAIAATKRDMESNKIMDRLICGDVGYGKTEVAIRAAFKAVNDGKQVAFLVPTTILAQQHYNTLQERLGDFPVKVEMLSRFRTPAQQKKTLEDLRKGQLEIVVGTHRLLSKDVKFKDLGLLIVDEEQRFGVTHKEKIKQMKRDVDVLTLSATPIPRTLHMSLIGIRDMSVLEEPPIDRIPIQTFVMEHNKEIIREAVNRELARGGQVYYVYNRVKNIEETAAQVMELVPDANVAYAHGQMSERQLENIMMSFINGEIDVLIATTIIETGLDIPNVNTIIIDNADQMGLSQLYQLRGRVGRSNRTAYAFLMYKRDKMLREVAEKRLAAIREFTALGSGIRVAMRDLEIRGAGNLLGAAQSGHMEAVGYDLYCKLLNDAVLALKGEQPEEEEFETSIDLAVDAYIPATYIKSEFQKLDMYKRIAGIETAEELQDMQDELIDRFGDIPEATQNLLQIALLKASAHCAYITQISQKAEGIRFYLQSNDKMANGEWTLEGIAKVIERYQGKLRFVPGETPYVLYLMEMALEGGMPGQAAMRSGKRGPVAGRKAIPGAKQIFQVTEEIIGQLRDLLEANGEEKKGKADEKERSENEEG